VDLQCPLNSTCNYNGTDSFCLGYGTIPLGQPCSTYLSCAKPGTICSSNGTTEICKTNGTTPLGAFCAIDTERQLDECVNGTRCTTNATGYNYLCQAPFLPGSPCVTYSSSAPQCLGSVSIFANELCVPATPNGYGSCNAYYDNCLCVAPLSVALGQPCNNSIQCKSNAFCNGTCNSVNGMDCATVNDCGNGLPEFDCNCNQKCYLLNAPTPVAPPTPPTPPTPQPCDAKVKAWLAVQPANWQWPDYGYGYVTGYTFNGGTAQYPLVQSLLTLSVADQALAIDVACCFTCPTPVRFNVPMSQGYQMDCKARTLVPVADTCDDTRNLLAILNCFVSYPTSSATTASVGLFGTLLIAVFSL